MSETAQALQQGDKEGARNADLIRLMQENLRLNKRLDAMAAEIAWLKHLHDKELEFRERELVLREKSQPALAPVAGADNGLAPSASETIKRVNGHGETDRRQPNGVDMQAILEATLNGLTPKLDDAQPTEPGDPIPQAEASLAAAAAELAATATAESVPSSNDDFPDIPAFLADPSGRRKTLPVVPPSAAPDANEPPRNQRLVPKRRRLAGLIG